jgi:hypothetical protein
MGMERSNKKEVVNADEYAAMRRELVGMYRFISGGICDGDCSAIECRDAKDLLKACPIAAELSKQEGGNG